MYLENAGEVLAVSDPHLLCTRWKLESFTIPVLVVYDSVHPTLRPTPERALPRRSASDTRTCIVALRFVTSDKASHREQSCDKLHGTLHERKDETTLHCFLDCISGHLTTYST